MKDRFDNTPMVCCRTTVELRDREATLLAQFRSAIIETKELQEVCVIKSASHLCSFLMHVAPIIFPTSVGSRDP
jgi:hypothetical protein